MMNNVKKVVVMDFKYLLRYKEFLLNNQNHKSQQPKQQQQKQQQPPPLSPLPQPHPRANFCTFCCDDCDGSCTNGRYASRTLVNNVNNINHINHINNINNVNNINKIKNLNVSVMLCSKLCDDNVYNDCICL